MAELTEHVRCEAGVHHFIDHSTCVCGKQLSAPDLAEGREGMVTVYDSLGRYLGCMGVETWKEALLKG